MSLHAREYWHWLLRFSGSPLGFIKGKYMRTWGAMKMSLPPWTLWKLVMLTSREQPSLI